VPSVSLRGAFGVGLVPEGEKGNQACLSLGAGHLPPRGFGAEGRLYCVKPGNERALTHLKTRSKAKTCPI